jgi:peptidoglycan DL-endopeptidase CwlO
VTHAQLGKIHPLQGPSRVDRGLSPVVGSMTDMPTSNAPALRRLLIPMIAAALAFTVAPPASAAPSSIASAQREVDRLRELAAEKYEAANEAKIEIARLQRETESLVKTKATIEGQVDKRASALAKLAISQYQAGGLGEDLSILFSRDPSGYLNDATTLDIVSKRYGSMVRDLQATQKKLANSQLVLQDRTRLLQAQQTRLQQQVRSAQADLAKAESILKNMKASERKKLERLQKQREDKIYSASKKVAAQYKGDSSRGSLALRYALAQLGDIYVWAAAGPTRWDCSGLTMRSFQQAGVSLPHSSRMQYRYGRAVSRGDLRPGDLVFFGNPISHVAIYMGGNKMVQAPRPGKRVEVVSFSGRFGTKPYIGARRL